MRLLGKYDAAMVRDSAQFAVLPTAKHWRTRIAAPFNLKTDTTISKALTDLHM
ncbi:hypothetical protein BVRB_8g182030 [Beta vulgaris subsp. vulgaris]|nr:hypothetical protein BVRB_8g182030 [Beta vulgaris subsp. vulgaris]